jgi:hypothetical protein
VYRQSIIMRHFATSSSFERNQASTGLDILDDNR